MRRVGIGLLCAVGGFVLGALLTGLLVARASSNTHDLSVEASMTAIFAGGPLGAIIGFLCGFIWARAKPKT